jgi:hypothetical protein
LHTAATGVCIKWYPPGASRINTMKELCFMLGPIYGNLTSLSRTVL